ncbi:hypothetical protein V2J09_008256 [Rumex salicifolius]
MRHLINRFSCVADSATAAPTTTSYCLLSSETLNSPRKSASGGLRKRISKVPSGHVPVYVGDEMERFAVSADQLNHPIFIQLLNRSAQEYGYEQRGVLHIPCHVAVFERVLHALRSGTLAVSAEALGLVDPIFTASP